MKPEDVDEAVDVLRVAIMALQASVPGTSGRTGAAFRYACGDLLVSAPSSIAAAILFTQARSCFDLAVEAGATLNGLLTLRVAVTSLAPTGQPAIYVAGICYCFALAAEVRILSATTFTSSDAALRALAVISAGYDLAQDWTADNGLPDLYQSLLGAGAAATRDLMSRAANLPRLTTYKFASGTSSHALAYRLYGDAGRADELRAENQVIHPAFMPPTGTALSD